MEQDIFKELTESVDFLLSSTKAGRKKLKIIYKVIDKEIETLKDMGFDINKDEDLRNTFIEEMGYYISRVIDPFIDSKIEDTKNKYDDISSSDYEKYFEEARDQSKKEIETQIAFAPNRGRQEFAVRNMFANDVFFGGALGGGKTFTILMRILFIMYICVEINKEKREAGLITGGARFLVLRRDLGGLKDFISKTFEIYPLIGGNYTDKKWTFEIDGNIFTVELGYIKDQQSFNKFQGQEYIGIYIDEAGQFKEDEFTNINLLKTRLRNPYGFPSDFMMTANPGGPGHHSLQKMYGIPSDGSQDIIVSKTYKGIVIDRNHPKYNLEYEDDTNISYRLFIPSTIKDNPYLANTNYIESLRSSGLTEKQINNLIEGKWTVDAGGMFDDVFDERVIVLDSSITEVPNSWIWFRGYDYGTRDPYAGLVFAKNNGKGDIIIDGKPLSTPIGTVVAVNEVYGGGRKDPDKPFQGDGLWVEEQASLIKKMEEKVIDRYDLEQILPGFADSSIYTNGINTETIEGSAAEPLLKAGLKYIPQKKPKGSRVQGWMKIRQMMRNTIDDKQEQPHLYILDNCESLIKETKAAQYDTKNMTGDLPDKAADHALDVLRYNVHTPKVRKVSKQPNNTRMPSRFG